MAVFSFVLLIALAIATSVNADVSGAGADAAEMDWLVQPPTQTAEVLLDVCWDDGLCGIELRNGLISRRFVTSPAFGTVDLLLNATRERGGLTSMLRAIGPEASVSLNGTVFNVGALRQNSTFLGYMNRSALVLLADPTSFRFSHHVVSVPDAAFPWTPGTRHSPTQVAWPPKGVRFEAVFNQPATPPVVAVASFPLTGKSGVTTQYLALEQPLTARRWRLQVNATFSQYQAVLAEVQFCQSPSRCMRNNGTAAQSTVTASSGWQADSPRGGAPWNAVDGDVSTCWDSVASAATGVYTLDFDLGSAVTVQGLNLTTLGDNAHDPQAMLLEALKEVVMPKGLRVSLVYDLYDGIPLMTMQMRVGFSPDSPADEPQVLVSGANVTRLAVLPPFGAYLTSGSHQPGSDAEGSPDITVPSPWLQAKTDQAHGATCAWISDLPNSYNANCDCEDLGAVEPILICQSQSAGFYVTPQSQNFTSYRVLLLVNDDSDIERQSLARSRVTQLLAPHTMENPIFFHATDVYGAGFNLAVDRMQEVGFEMLVFSFGSGFNLENSSTFYLQLIAKQVAYANAKGIEVGGYDLISLDRSDLPAAFRQLDSSGNVRGNACFASGWYDQLTELAINFIKQTNLSMLETDGPYGGGDCYATNHAHHHDHGDSIWAQTSLQNQFYHLLREHNIFVNQPDDYFFQGGSKTAQGYNEFQYSLPRWEDLSLSRAGMYDDLYMHLPTQGWMFTPLVQYHSGGSEATFKGHNDAYEWALAQYLGAGVASCYRGDVPFWDEESQAIVTKWIAFYKRHRATLIQPIVHLRRPSMQTWDGWLHVNPHRWTTRAQQAEADPAKRAAAAAEVAVAMIFNPTSNTIATTIWLPLYYTGLTTSAQIVVDEDAGGKPTTVSLDRNFGAVVSITMAPSSIHTIAVYAGA